MLRVSAVKKISVLYAVAAQGSPLWQIKAHSDVYDIKLHANTSLAKNI
jgi:hypothetical protein